MNPQEQLFWQYLMYISLGVTIMVILVYSIRRIMLNGYRKRMVDYHSHIMSGEKPTNAYMLVKYGSDQDKKVGFIKCAIVHVYKNEKKVNVVFKSGNKTYSKATSKDVDIKLIYPEWAVPSSDIQK